MHSWLDWIGVFIPFFSWIRKYQWRKDLLPDLAVSSCSRRTVCMLSAGAYACLSPVSGGKKTT